MKEKLFIILALLLTAVSGAWAQTSGNCGNGVTWSYDEGTLTISGSGAMADYESASGQPWKGYSTTITSVVIGSGVTHIGDRAFRSCGNLATVTFATGSQLSTIGTYAFAFTGLTSITIPASVTSIAKCAFQKCASLATITFATGSQLASIGEYAFFSCDNTNLTSLTIPASVKSIGDYAFKYCTYLESVTFATGSQLTTIGDAAFQFSGLTSIEIPANVTTIEPGAFKDCSSLATVTIPASVTSIGDNAFYGCSELKSITVYAPPALTLGNDAFYGCHKDLIIYVFSDLVDDYKAATNWNAYSGIITAIPSVGGNCGPEGHASDVKWELAFTSTSHTLTISGSDAIADYYNPDDQPWKNYRSTITNVVIKNSVKRIGASAFYKCTNLKTVTISASVESINENAFKNCTSLTTVTFDTDSELMSIGQWCFSSSGLTSIELPAYVESIDTEAFSYCTNLTSVTIGKELRHINDRAFQKCTSLATVIVYSSTTPTLGTEAFDDCANDLKIYVLNDYVDAYKDAWRAYDGNITGFNGSCGATGHELNVIWALTGNSPNYTLTIGGSGAMANYGGPGEQPWKDYRSSITSVIIEDGVTRIGGLAFADCDNASLTSVTIPASVTSIGDGAFHYVTNLATVTFATGSRLETIGDAAFYNSGLTTIEIPTKVTSIGDGSFYGSNGLMSITIPASVTYIGSSAFKGCSNLESVTLNSNPYIGTGAFDDIKDGATVTMNLTANSADGAYWMTFYNNRYNFVADENTQVFKAALSDKSLTLTELTTDKIVKNNNAVILKSTASPIVMTLTSTGGSNDFTGNQLAGVYDPAGKTSDGTMYVLNNGTNGVGFYKLHAGSTLGVGKAYLTYSGTTAPSFFGFEDGTEIPGATDISTTDFTDKAGAWYTLSGVRLNAKPTQKGIYIVNGNKVVIK